MPHRHPPSQEETPTQRHLAKYEAWHRMSDSERRRVLPTLSPQEQGEIAVGFGAAVAEACLLHATPPSASSVPRAFFSHITKAYD
jgi:hypothetical protein